MISLELKACCQGHSIFIENNDNVNFLKEVQYFYNIITLTVLMSSVESKARPLNPEVTTSSWVPNPEVWTMFVVTPRTQATPNTCKTLLPEKQTAPWFIYWYSRGQVGTFLHYLYRGHWVKGWMSGKGHNNMRHDDIMTEHTWYHSFLSGSISISDDMRSLSQQR